MRLSGLLFWIVLPTAGAQIIQVVSLAETMAIPDNLPCCEDMPAMTSLGLLSQSFARRSKTRYCPYMIVTKAAVDPVDQTVPRWTTPTLCSREQLALVNGLWT